MMDIKRVALAGKGRIGSFIVDALANSGFETTVLTRAASHITNVPSGVTVVEVDYESEDSLAKALKGQDAVVSMVAMSAIPNQTKIIDAAIKAGVKFFIPSDASMATRDARAQWLPIYGTVIAIQKYLEAQGESIDWAVVNCGCLLEFGLEYPFILDFDNHAAAIYDGGNQPLSVSDCNIFAQAVVGLLKQPSRVSNHRIRVQGGTLTQNEALRIAEKYSKEEWKVERRDSQKAIDDGLKSVQKGVADAEFLSTLLTIASAATFGKDHYEAAYKAPDNDWLGVSPFHDGEVEEFVRKRVEIGPYSIQSSAFAGEKLTDVEDGFKFGTR